VDASQNVGIGTASPTQKLDVNGISAFGSGDKLSVYSNNVLQTAGTLDVGTIGSAALIFNTNNTERMRIDSSGNVGIGTSSPSALLHVRKDQTAATYIMADNLGTVNAATSSGFACAEGGSVTAFFRSLRDATGIAQLFNTSASPLTFGTNNTERARIDSSGNLLVGTTSTVGSIGRVQSIQTAQSLAGLSVDATNASFDYKVVYLNATRAASSVFDFIQCTTGGYGTTQFRVRGDGVILAQNTTVESISDVRVKENVRDASEGLQTVLGLRPVRFDFKEGFGNNRKNQLGFIAQEVEAVFPDAVDVAGELDENGDPYKSVGPSAMIPVLVKAIQEQQALITQLQADVAALKGASA
jgi:hypothetical protein